eukprot:TRINITY_DN15670_c0_g1_i3.p1 TRINITY_DN15670_c0_g1~~TRINITY_DN15670_c0_g1_i3.p1  ORF type:complete len:829 (-),score=148.33 TRINITY_DN15670_c0_g1_i3:35-2389(-)
MGDSGDTAGSVFSFGSTKAGAVSDVADGATAGGVACDDGGASAIHAGRWMSGKLPKQPLELVIVRSDLASALDGLESNLKARLDELEARHGDALSELSASHQRQLDSLGDRLLSGPARGLHCRHGRSELNSNLKVVNTEDAFQVVSPVTTYQTFFGHSCGREAVDRTSTKCIMPVTSELPKRGPSKRTSTWNSAGSNGIQELANEVCKGSAVDVTLDLPDVTVEISDAATQIADQPGVGPSTPLALLAARIRNLSQACDEEETCGLTVRSSILDYSFSNSRPVFEPPSQKLLATSWLDVFEGFVRGPSFDIASGIPIVLFGILLGVETDYMSEHGGESNFVFMMAHVCFNIWAIAELFIRVVVFRRDFVFGEDKVWNALDVVMVATSVMDVVVWIAVREKAVLSAGMLRTLKGVRMLRLVKTCRIARMLRYMHEFKKMVFSLQASITTLFWCVTVIFSLVYIFAILFTQGATDHIARLVANGQPDHVQIGELNHFYGSLTRTIFSLYIAMSNGMSWEAVLRPLMPVHWSYTLLFMIFITFSIFGLLNVLTSVFVESTIKSAQHYKELVIQEAQSKKETAVVHLRNLFKQMDMDSSGELDLKEMRKYLAADCECIGYLEACDININDVDVLFRLIDRDNSGFVNLDEFCEGCMTLKGEARSYDIHCLMYEQSRSLNKWSHFQRVMLKNYAELGQAFLIVGEVVTTLQENLETHVRTVDRLMDGIERAFGALDASFVVKETCASKEGLCSAVKKTPAPMEVASESRPAVTPTGLQTAMVRTRGSFP